VTPPCRRAFPLSDAVDAPRMISYVRLNLLCCLVAMGWIVCTRVWIMANAWLDAVTGLIAGMALSLLCAEILIRRRRYPAAIVTVAVADWTVAITVTAMVPFALLTLPLVILLPVFLAIPHLRRFQLNAMFGAAVLVIGATALAGRFLDGVGLEAQAPGWLLDALAVTFIPITACLALLLAWQSHVALARRAAALRDSHTRLVTAADGERSQIERTLRESTRHRVVAAGTHLRTAQQVLATGEQAGRHLDQVIKELQQASRELRDLGHGIFPPELEAHGLPAALRSAAQRASVPVTLQTSTIERYPPEIEASIYFCCLQALTLAGQCGAADITISLTDSNGPAFEVSGNCGPRGTANFLSSHGLTSVEDRLGAVGGSMTVSASDGQTHISGRIRLPYPSLPTPCGWRRWWDASCGILGKIWTTTSRIYGRIPTAGPEHKFVTTGITSVTVVLAGAAAISFLTYAIVPHPWILIIGVLDFALYLMLGWTGRKTQSNSLHRALFIAMVTTWIYAVNLAPLFPVALYQTPLLMILPVILAIPHVQRRTFQAVTAITVLVALMVALAGRFVPGVGAQEQIPGRLLDVIMLIVITFTATLALFMASLNHAALIHRAEALQNTRARSVAAADRERRRIERDLHDGAQQRLVAAAVEACVARRILDSSAQQAQTLLTQLAQELAETDTELRNLASGIYPPELLERGLEAALRTAARRSSIPTTVYTRDIGRFSPETEINVYFCCLEALQNAIKHAGTDATVAISLQTRQGLVFDIHDTGQGCDLATLESGQGYANMRDRMSAIGGKLTVRALPGQGVQVSGHIAA
jgi:signal transduction histidine kinase